MIERTDYSRFCSRRRETNPITLSGIIQMAKALKLDVIAEGVETPEQLSFLTQAGCDDIQVFLFHRPLTPKDFEQVYIECHTMSRQSAS